MRGVALMSAVEGMWKADSAASLSLFESGSQEDVGSVSGGLGVTLNMATLRLRVKAAPFGSKRKVAAVRRLEPGVNGTRQTRRSPTHSRHNGVHAQKHASIVMKGVMRRLLIRVPSLIAELAATRTR
ncbi:hypothetical protein D3C75_1102760 [compost metagenome]